jgi:hypothetical protein
MPVHHQKDLIMRMETILNRQLSTSLTILLSSITLLSACGGGGSDGSSSVSASTATIEGTVPGTRIEAFGDNGAYYVVHSTDDGTPQHPFAIEVPAGLGIRLVMTINEGTDNEVVSPIGWRDDSTQIHTRIMLGAGDRVDVGHIALAMSCAEAAGDVDGDGDNDDVDHDCVLDSPFILDDAHSPLGQADADHDGLNDFDDPDHGHYSYSAMEIDPLDHDGDGVPNMFDPHYMPAPGFTDNDRDGLNDDTDDANPGNIAGSNHRFIDDTKGDGYHEDDRNRDGFHDDDMDRDGFHDDDMNRDGFHDDDMNRDGFHDNDMNHGMRDIT